MANWFKAEELACKCGKCGMGINNFDVEALNMFNKLREALGFPLKVVSACRCPERNLAEGGKKDSAHVTTPGKHCTAMDLSCVASNNRYRTIDAALVLGFKRIGLAKTFIHLDVSKELPQPVVWFY